MSSDGKELCVLPMECVRGFKKSWINPFTDFDEPYFLGPKVKT
jgi:hypothetical protein